jgi:hypothetical protein
MLYELISEEAYNDLTWLMEMWDMTEVEVLEKVLNDAADKVEDEINDE